MAPRTFRSREEALGLPRPRWTDPRSIYLADLKQSVKVLRKYARGFTTADGYDLRDVENWSANKKRTVTRYINELQKLAVRPHEIVTPRAKSQREQKKRLRRLQEISGHTQGYPRFQVAVVPKSEEGLQVKFRKDGIIEFKYPVGKHFIIEFDKQKLANGDFLDIAYDVLNFLDRSDQRAVMVIQAGMYTIRRGGRSIAYDPTKPRGRDPTARALAAWMDNLATKYPETDPHHAYTDWMRGVSVNILDPDLPREEMGAWRQRQMAERMQMLEEQRLARRRRKDELEQYRVLKAHLRHTPSEMIAELIQRLMTKRDKRKGKLTVRDATTLQLYRDILEERARRGLL